MSEPLVDNEGFPRNDLDLWQVRTARNKIISKFVKKANVYAKFATVGIDH